MTQISAEMVRQLREKTGAGMMDCKAALAESNGSFEQAIEILRKRGLKDLGKRADKIAAEGTLGVYVHSGDRVVSVVELNCETDFVARNDEFRQLARDIAMHVAAMRPRYTSVEEVPPAVLEKEKEIIIAQLDEAQKAKADKIIPGRMDKWFQEHVLEAQPYVRDDSGKVTIKSLVEQYSIKTGEKVRLRRFIRLEVGEGIERASQDFAAEVAATISAGH